MSKINGFTMKKYRQEPPFRKRIRDIQKKTLQIKDIPIKKTRNINGYLHYFADWLANWHITKILQAIGSLALLVTLYGFYADLKDKKQSRVVNSWQLVTTKASGNSGKIDALEHLNNQNIPLVGIDLSSPDKTRQDGTYLKGINLAGADLKFAKFSGANLSSANLANTKLWTASLDSVDLINSNLQGAELINADLKYSNLQNAHFEKAKLDLAQFQHALADDSYFSGASLQYAILNDVFLERVDFQGADLFRAEINNSTLLRANLSDVNLEKANLIGSDLRLVNFKDANLLNTVIGGADISQAINLTCAQLKKATNWKAAYRDQKLACGESIPSKPWLQEDEKL